MANFPVPDATPSWWRTQLHRLDDYVSSECVPEESDVVVIGAGIAGASVAYHLLQQNKGQKRPRVTILEARQACSGATGRNGKSLNRCLVQTPKLTQRARRSLKARPLQLH